MPQYFQLAEAPSTNTYAKEHASTLPHGAVVYTYCQTAGRGQQGNSWESEPGKNLAFSLLLHRPEIEPQRQFFISEATAVAIVEVLGQYCEGLRIKWPNDIYHVDAQHPDSKLAGILIEQALDTEGIAYTVIGVGININQTEFRSNAPNPVSLKQITGQDYDTDALLHQICERIEQRCTFPTDGSRESYLQTLHEQYLNKFYRYDGRLHLWQLPTGEELQAKVETVEPTGHLLLRHSDGAVHRYAFKEVKHVINNHIL